MLINPLDPDDAIEISEVAWDSYDQLSNLNEYNK
jgi:hypothetical protein